LYNIPIAIGDRSEQIQDLPHALMGTRFPVEGNKVRLFMQWGEGLPAQHLDMDLSCKVAYESKMEYCSYSNLHIKGCIHSGDIINIPEKVGTAEYIDINLDDLAAKDAKFVSFTCNAYSNGSLTPNLIVGWMNSKYPMTITKNGVAYDPKNVQHQIRISQTLNKGLVFGVLDIQNREIIWLELPFNGQRIQNLDYATLTAYLKKLDSKLKIGNLLDLKAKCQGLKVVTNLEEADEIYDAKWALNTAAVNNLFLEK
jgi:hypothetical protein